MIRVEVLVFDGCPNGAAAAELAQEAVAGAGADANVSLVRIDDEADARARRFLGSPTIRVDGRDVEPGSESRSDFGLSCRVYRTPDGVRGLPPVEYLTAALAERS